MRALLVCAAALAIGCCCMCAVADFPVYSASNFRACMEAAKPSLTIVWPADAEYAQASKCPNVRNQMAHPTAVVYAKTTVDVALAVKCAAKWNVKASAASGRHSFNNAAVMDGYLTIDLSNMTQVNLTKANGQLTAWTGAGITNSLLVAELLTKGPRGAASLSGSCPSVGTGGYYLGGGMGMLSPMYGLGCDQVLAIEVVLADGNVVTADAEHHPDLFWASCGGGPGFGIVTQYKVKVPVHDDPRVTRFVVFFPAIEGSTDAISSWQRFIATKNGQNGLMLTGATLLPAGPGTPPALASAGMFLGSMEAASKAIKASGLLDNGVMLDFSPPMEFPTFGHFMIDEYMRLMNDWNSQLLAEELGHAWDRSSAAHFDQFVKLALQPGSLVSSADNKFWRWFVINTCYMVPELSSKALKALMAFQDSPTDAECATVMGKTVFTTQTDYLCLAKALSNQINWNHLLGGAVAAVPTKATAFPHRKMLSPLCHEPGMPYGSYDSKGELLPRANITLFDITFTYVPQQLLEAFIQRIKQFQRALLRNTPEIGAYYNYILPSLEDWQRSYWGSNYPRLQRVKAAYDPTELFSKPFTVQMPAPEVERPTTPPAAGVRKPPPRHRSPARRPPPSHKMV